MITVVVTQVNGFLEFSCRIVGGGFSGQISKLSAWEKENRNTWGYMGKKEIR